MKTGKRHIENGEQFNHLFPNPNGENKMIKRLAGLDDTIQLMKKVIATTLDDTKAIAEKLKASSEKQTLQNIWKFCFTHLQYTRDEAGKEQVRRPSRVWRDRKQGVDCDCMSVFIGSILTNLGIPFSLRLTKYQSSEFEHVYPIAHTTNGILIMDTVVHQFNTEVPYATKKDISMDLEYLNGFEDEEFDEFKELDDSLENDYPIDAQLLLDSEDLEGLFKSKSERKANKAKRKAKRSAKKAKRKEKRANKPPLKKRLKKGLHLLNRFNPATALLRAGVLASMKLNVMKVASKLRFGYWSDSEASKNNMDMNKFNQLKRIREKLEVIYFGAGGKTANLKKAILTGKGNRDRRVILNGLGEIIPQISDEDDLRTILGEDLYNDELAEVESGVNGLGAVATGAAVVAATGVIGAIATLLKKLGGLFKKGSPQAEKELLQDNTADEEEKTRKFSIKNLLNLFKRNPLAIKTATTKSTSPATTSTETEEFSEDAPVVVEQRNHETTDKPDADEKLEETKGFLDWVKNNPLLTAGVATAILGGTFLVIKSTKKNKKPLSGVPKKRKPRKAKKATKKVTAKRKSTSKKGGAKKKRKRSTSVSRTTRIRKIELL